MHDSLKLVYRKNLTDDLGIFRFESTDGSILPDFKPGQFVPLGLDVENGKTIFRDYSLTSIPSERNYYEFYIKHKEHPTEGKFTSLLFQMELGSTVYWQKPRGVFTMEEKHLSADETRQIVLIATGSGLAPFVGYIRFLKTIQKPKNVILLHGVSYAAELGYKDFLEETSAQKNSLNLTYIPTVSRPNNPLSKDWSGNTGRVESLISGIEKHNSKLENIMSSKITPENSIFYLCGYKTMVDSVTLMLTDAGFASMQNKRSDGTFDIKFELFGI